MDYQKALTILELKPNFTEEELKSSHRSLSKIYHPDKYKEGTELYLQMQIKQQEINAARDCLRDYLKERKNIATRNQTKTTIYLNNYKKAKINDLKHIINYDDNIQNDELKKVSEIIINNIIYTFETDVWMPFITTKEQVDKMYNLCIISIKKIFESFVMSFYQKYYIDKLEVTEQINYNCDLKTLYNQLLKIKEKYSKEEKIKKILETEIEIYKSYEEYEHLKLLIDLCKKNTLYYIKQNNFQNINNEINKMHKQIKEEVFDIYYSLKKQLSELETIIDVIDDEQIINTYKNTLNSFKRGSSFYDTEESIKKIKEMIDIYQKKQQFKKAESQVNDIYQKLIERYTSIIKKYNITTESELIKKTHDFLNEILQLFIKGCTEYKKIQYFKLFNNITFKNIENDKKTIKIIIQTLISNNSKIYIKKIFENPGDEYSFFYFDEENMLIYKVNDGFITHEDISYEQLEEDYTSLTEFLESSTFIGENKMKLNSSIVQLLYQKDDISLYRQGDTFHIIKNITLLNITKSRNDDCDKYKDKKYIYSLIEEQIKHRIEEYKRQNKQYTLRTFEEELEQSSQRKK